MASQLIGGRFRGETDAGLPLVGGMLYTYASGTTTPKAAYTDATLATPTANPLTLNARGEAQVWLGAGAYSLKLSDAAGVTVWTVDGVTSADTAGTGQAAADALRADLASGLPGKGSSLVSGVASVVGSVAGVRLLPKTGPNRADTLGYWLAGDGGGASYRLDLSDTTSLDDGGAVIVAADGGRWKLLSGNAVSVHQFGAKGNGSTDDTAAIQAGIDYVQSKMTVNTSTSPAMGPQVLVFHDGYYKVSAPLVVTRAITIRGSKSSEFSTGTRIFQTASGDLLQFNPSGGGLSFSIEGIALISTVPGTGHLLNVNKGSPGYNSWRVLNCCFSNPQQMAIRAIGDDIQIINTTFDVSGYSGNCIQLGTNTTSEKASNVRIIGCDFFNIPSRCVLIYNAQSVLIANNQVSQPDALTTSGAFVDALDSSAVLCAGVSIVGNNLYGVRRFVAASGAVGWGITGNTAYNCGTGAGEVYNCMEFINTCSNITISGNNINGSYGGKAIFSNGGSLSNVGISGNTFSGSGSGAALVCGAMLGVVSGNVISGWATPVSAADLYAIGYSIKGVQYPPFGASIGIDAAAGDYVIIVASATSAFTIAAPTNPGSGQQITIQVYNATGTTLGAATWASAFRLAAWTQPSAASSRVITFQYSSGLAKWTEVSRTADIPN